MQHPCSMPGQHHAAVLRVKAHEGPVAQAQETLARRLACSLCGPVCPSACVPVCSSAWAVDNSVFTLDRSTFFIMRSALDSRLCVEVPEDDGDTSRLAPCSSTSDRQKFAAIPNGVDYGNVPVAGSIVSFARQNFKLCGYATSYAWSTDSCPGGDSEAQFFWYTMDSTFLKSYAGGGYDYDTEEFTRDFGCFVADPATSRVLFGTCNASSLAGSWVIEIPMGMASGLALLACADPEYIAIQKAEDVPRLFIRTKAPWSKQGP